MFHFQNGNDIHYDLMCKENRRFVPLSTMEYRPSANSGKLIANYSGMDRHANINYEFIDIIKL